jgi:DUF4097 and DUF4098 domain-containing protein YvlB
MPSLIAADWSKSFRVSGSPVLDVRCSDANVDVRSGGSGEISARVVTKGWEIKPGEIEIVERQQGDRVDIEVKHPRGRWNWSSANATGRSVRLELTIPAKTRIHIETGDGNVTLHGVQTELRVETGDGNITGESLDGRLEAHTGDGNINIAGRFDSAAVDTGDGNVDLTALAGSTATGTWRIHTGDGNVRLRVPSNLKADIDAVSGDGRVSSNLPLTISSGKPGSRQVRGRLNGGGPTLTVRTGDGNISLSGS